MTKRRLKMPTKPAKKAKAKPMTVWVVTNDGVPMYETCRGEQSFVESQATYYNSLHRTKRFRVVKFREVLTPARVGRDG